MGNKPFEVRQVEKGQGYRLPFPNFEKALSFTNKVGEIAEEEGHHPEIVTEWGSVTVYWWSHKIKKIHLNDLILAERCDVGYSST